MNSVMLNISRNIAGNATSSDDHYYFAYFDNFSTSDLNYPGDRKSVPLWEALVKVCICSNVILLSLIGNILVILVVIYNKRLRTTTNYFIVNLAVSDLLVTCSCSWVTLVDDLTDQWILGNFFCKFNSFAQVTSLVSGIMTLMLIACDRFFGIVYAMKAHIIERKALPSLLVVWVISLATAFPMFLRKKAFEREWKDMAEVWCDDVWETVDSLGNVVFDRKSRIAYYTCVTFLLYFIPLIVMSCAYGGVIRTLWTSKAPGERLSKDVKVQTRVKQKVVIMLILIMVVFGVCWLPLQVTLLYSEYKDPLTQLGPWYEDFTFAAKILAFSNSAMNPLIYAGFNDNFRKGFKHMFGCYKKQRYTTLSKADESFQSSTLTTGMTRM